MPIVSRPRGWNGARVTEKRDDAISLSPEERVYISDAMAEGYTYEEAYAMALNLVDTRNPRYSPILARAALLFGASIMVYATGVALAQFVAILESLAWTSAAGSFSLAARMAASRGEVSLDELISMMSRGSLPGDLVKHIGSRAIFHGVDNCIARALGVARILNGGGYFSVMETYPGKAAQQAVLKSLQFQNATSLSIKELLASRGHGAHGIVLAARMAGGKLVGDGHVFNAVNWKGVVYFLEGLDETGGAIELGLSDLAEWNVFFFALANQLGL